MTPADANAKKRTSVTDLAYIAVFAAIIIVFAFVSIPVGTAGVPIVVQNIVCVLAGLVLGGKRGFLSVALFLGLGLVGLPVLAGGRSTLSAISGPTVGYLVGYMVSAFIAGAIAYRAPKSKVAMTAVFFVATVLAIFSQYVLGGIGLMIRSDMSLSAAAAAQLPFMLPGLVKAVFVTVIGVGIHAAFPDLRKKN